MSIVKTVRMPDLGDIPHAKVVEILVNTGSQIQLNQSLLSVESEKAMMEVPCEFEGCIETVCVSVGDVVKTGDQLVTVLVADACDDDAHVAVEEPSASKLVLVPELGGGQVKLIEWLVKPGAEITNDTPICVLESDKATMEVPSTVSGIVQSLEQPLGADLTVGQSLISVETNEDTSSDCVVPAQESQPEQSPVDRTVVREANVSTEVTSKIYAGPAVRRMASLLEVNLNQVAGTGNKGRISKQDLLNYIKATLQSGTNQPKSKRPYVEPSDYGPTSTKQLSRIKKLSADYLHENWQSIPHVTQCIDAEVTDFEAYRKQLSQVYKPQGIRMTPLVFIMKALVTTLSRHPAFNASLSQDGQALILKEYFHMGVAVDTPNGLVVPVVKAVNDKSVVALAKELAALSQSARSGQLKPEQMRGQSFTISSLGGIGGTYFTPIINAPDVAILGIGQMQTKPVWQDDHWIPKLFLPLSLSYDHRVIDGAEAARFMVDLANDLSIVHTQILE